ncbi:hypothetical protein U8C37_10080 [Sinorhizobium medicae]|uniref:hypothetical protein n=1 Tax=Sinorhizobium medicae TaxID=110321 RepID=UPI002AF6BA43|nr:hypothetical protein [Sinorhizobium medicae]WQO84017.1 hypothetical protein U8C37_10080 [Sinorhizobium medicae]
MRALNIGNRSLVIVYRREKRRIASPKALKFLALIGERAAPLLGAARTDTDHAVDALLQRRRHGFVYAVAEGVELFFDFAGGRRNVCLEPL